MNQPPLDQPTIVDFAQIELPVGYEKTSTLVLCKHELFWQTEDGDTISSWYPISGLAALCIAALLKIPIMSA